jgi:hypothetical protein
MASIVLHETLPYSAVSVWAIVGDVSRYGWVPAVDSIEFANGIRGFTMASIGEAHERVISCDSKAQRLQYSAIKTPSNVE